jgi:hypothetical protein
VVNRQGGALRPGEAGVGSDRCLKRGSPSIRRESREPNNIHSKAIDIECTAAGDRHCMYLSGFHMHVRQTYDQLRVSDRRFVGSTRHG